MCVIPSTTSPYKGEACDCLSWKGLPWGHRVQKTTGNFQRTPWDCFQCLNLGCTLYLLPLPFPSEATTAPGGGGGEWVPLRFTPWTSPVCSQKDLWGSPHYLSHLQMSFPALPCPLYAPFLPFTPLLPFRNPCKTSPRSCLDPCALSL